MDFSGFSDFENHEGVGFPIHLFLIHFNDTFQKSGGALLESFLNEFSEVKKWILVSDYAFYDKNKKHDVVTFSIIPYIADFEVISKSLGGMAPADLKKIRSVRGDFITFLKDGPIFNISIQLDRERKLFQDERLYHRKKLEMMIGQLEYWCETTPAGTETYKKFIKTLLQLEKIIQGPGGNLKAVRDIEIVSKLAAYLMADITSRANIELIGWLSDRDALLSFKAAKLGNFMLDLTSFYYHVFCQLSNESEKAKLVMGLPGNDNKVWYDNLIRVPDLLAGTLADYDYKNNSSTHGKFISVIENLFVSERRNIFFRIDFKPHLAAVRLTWDLADDGATES